MIPPELKQQLAEQLKRHVLFSLLEDEDIEELIEAIEVVGYSLGDTIITEGEQGDCAYLIHKGKVRVFKETEKGKKTTLGTLSAGDVFGEYAILHNVTRTASVRVSEDATLFRIDQTSFLRLIKKTPALSTSFEKLIQQRSLMDFLRLKTIFAEVPVRTLLDYLDHFQSESFQVGDNILEKGVIPDRLYIIHKGEAEVRPNGKVYGAVGPGAILAEGVLLRRQRTTVNYTATTPTECYAIKLDQLQELLKEVPELRDELLQERRGGERRADFESLTQTTEEEEETILPPPTKSWWQNKYPWVPQHDESDCGAAALAMVARYYGVKLSVGQLREKAQVGRHGSSMLNLATAAESIGMQTQAVRTDWTHLVQLPMPGVALWEGRHYVVVYEVTETQVIVGDPAIGIVKLTPQEFQQGWSGQLLLLTATTKLQDNQPSKSPFRRFVPFLTPFKKLLVEILLASFLLELLRLSWPIFTQLVVDKVLVHQNVSMLNILLLGMIFLGAFQIGSTIVRQYLLQHVGLRLGLAMSADLFRQMMRLPMRFFHTRKIGDFLTRFEDNQRIKEMLTGRIITSLLDVLMILTSLGLMLFYNVKLTLVALAAFPFYIGLTVIFTPWLKRANRKKLEQEAQADSSLVESIKAISTIKDANAELASRWKYENLVVMQGLADYEGRRLNMWLDGLFRSVNILANSFLLWYGAHLVIGGELTVGQLMAFNSLVAMIAVPILGLVQLWFELQSINVALERLADIYDAKPEQEETTGVIRLPRLQGHIEFKNVCFRYNPEDRNILRNVTLEIRPGQTIALVGRSGAGKTTLAMLLQRFYSPTEGTISIDGFDLCSADMQTLRSQLGVVAQETMIFNGTIRENIAIADPDVPLDRIIEVTKQANVHEMIMSFPMAYDTVIGELGVRLSGGQRQRLAIARALLKNPRILVLDEATSALDYESERAVQQNLQDLMRDRTTLIIAHRLSTVQNADRIIVLDAGNVVEEGTHHELQAKRGLYYYLTSQQIGE